MHLDHAAASGLSTLPPKPPRPKNFLIACALLGLVPGYSTAHDHAPAPAAPHQTLAVARLLSSTALPQLPGKRITLRTVDFPPGGYSPAHRHGGSVTVYVLSGAIRSQLQGQAPIVYQAGESFFEPPGAIHLLAENTSASEPASILAIFVADDDATLTTSPE